MMDKSAGDSFKEKIAGDQLGDAAQRRVHQSLGRPLSAAEEAFADALDEHRLHGSGTADGGRN